MTSWEFPAEGPVDLHVRIPSGSIAVTATSTQTISVRILGDDGADGQAAAAGVEHQGRKLSITAPPRSRLLGGTPALDVTVTVPSGSCCSAETASADIGCLGELGGLRARTASGDVTAERITGETDVTTSSGDVRLQRCGAAARLKSVSGDIRVDAAGGDTESQTVSGDVHIGGVAAGRITANTASGDITVAVVPGTGVQLDLSTLSGGARSELEPEDGPRDRAADASVTCRSVSGDVTVQRAA
jgi:hypothetical protein